MTRFIWSVSAIACWMMGVSGCIPRKSAGTTTPPDSQEAKKCPPDAMIEDGEDNNNQATVQKGRSGYWYTFADKVGTTVSPPPGEQGGGAFAMAQGGASGSAYAARITGKVGTGEVVYGGMGLNFTDPKGQYDMSGYKGIAFWAKRGEKSTGKVRIKLPDVNTDPEGKACTTACYNDFGVDLELTTSWARYTIAFRTMTQLPGWGAPRPPAIDASKVYGLQWQVNSPGADFDIWVDDIEFTGCP